MIRGFRRGFLVTAIWAVTAGVVLAQDSAAGESEAFGSDMGWRGWGVRAGLASGPDQVVGGFHFDVGEWAENIWFRPDVVVGFGDDTISLVGSIPAWYAFQVDANVTPYAGGALAVGLFRVDKGNKGKGKGNNDETNVEIGLQIGGGAEWNLKSGRRFQVELRLDLIDVWDVVVFAGWTF